MMDFIQMLKDTWIFAVIWRMMMSLFQRKDYENYGKAMMGFMILLLVVSHFYNCFFDNIQTNFGKMIDNCIEQYKKENELYTLDLKIKEGYNLLNTEKEKEDQTQIKSEVEANDDSSLRYQTSSLKVDLVKISTCYVENIQLIQ